MHLLRITYLNNIIASNLAGIYLLRVKNRNTRTSLLGTCEYWLEFKLKTQYLIQKGLQDGNGWTPLCKRVIDKNKNSKKWRFRGKWAVKINKKKDLHLMRNLLFLW